jgi:hypothetical protein
LHGWLHTEQTGSCAPDRRQPSGAGLDPVRLKLDLDALALEHRVDQLVEATRDDERVQGGELGQARPDTDVLDHPRDDRRPAVRARSRIAARSPHAG